MGDSGSEGNIRRILDDAEFSYDGKKYKIVQNSKPSPETKTDFYIVAENTKNKKKVFKISYKKPSYTFVENKLKVHRAEMIFGENWSDKIRGHIMQKNTIKDNEKWKKGNPEESLADSFRNLPLVDFKNKKIMLGWRYEIEVLENAGTRRHSGKIRENIAPQVFYGEDYAENFRDAMIDGKSVPNSGIPDYILVKDPEEIETAQDVFGNLEDIKKYANKHKEMRVSFIAQYYRYDDKKSSWKTEGHSRQLAVWIKWQVVGRKLKGVPVLDTPLEKTAGEIICELNECLNNLGIAEISFEIDQLCNRLTTNTKSKR